MREEDLRLMAEEMRQYADKNRLDLIGAAVNPHAVSETVLGTRRIIEFDGCEVVVQFSCDVLSEGMIAWHLSFSRPGHLPLSDRLIGSMKRAFFVDGSSPLEVPSNWGPQVKQFIQLEKKRNGRR